MLARSIAVAAALSFLLLGCQAGHGESPGRTDGERSARSDSVRPGRYQIIALSPFGALKIDTETGRSWSYDPAKEEWVPVPTHSPAPEKP